jgi:hypothetical protein
MDSLITAAARALAAGDPLAALKRVALRDDLIRKDISFVRTEKGSPTILKPLDNLFKIVC